MTQYVCLPSDHSTGAISDWTNNRGAAMQKNVSPDRIDGGGVFGDNMFNTPADNRTEMIVEYLTVINASDPEQSFLFNASGAGTGAGASMHAFTYHVDGTWQIGTYDNDGTGNFDSITENNSSLGSMSASSTGVPLTFKFDCSTVGTVLVYLNGSLEKTITTMSSLTGLYAGVRMNWNSYFTSFKIGAASSPPNQVTGLTAEPRSKAAQLNWPAPSDNGNAITDYIIEYNPAGAGWSTFSDGTSTTPSCLVTGLAPGVSYVFRVSAVNAIGTGTASSDSSAVIPYDKDVPFIFTNGSPIAGSNGYPFNGQ